MAGIAPLAPPTLSETAKLVDKVVHRIDAMEMVRRRCWPGPLVVIARLYDFKCIIHSIPPFPGANLPRFSCPR